MPHPAAGKRGRSGYMLIEASAAYVIVTFAILSLLPVLSLSIKANERSEETLKEAELAFGLLEEVRLRRWDETTPLSLRPSYPAYTASASLGVDSGETASDKTTFDDLDDFNGWTENPPKDPLNGTLSGFAGYSRSVTVQYATSSLSVSASTTSYKLVTACAAKAKAAQICLQAVAAND